MAGEVLADPAASRAVLIGASRYSHDSLADLPAVDNNLERLARLLQDPGIWGLPAERCVTIGQHELATAGANRDVLNAIEDAAADATDTLLVYYAGHGLLASDESLHLALPDSNPNRLFTAVDYRWVRDAVRSATRVLRKVVILDCCFAGRAVLMSREDPRLDQTRIEGTFVLAAVASTAKALAVPGEEFTAFTSELVESLENGIPGGPPTLDMDIVYRRITAGLAAKSRPLPAPFSKGNGQRISFARNRSAAVERLTLKPAIIDLLKAQIRAAEAYPYRLSHTPDNGLSATYVQQQLRAIEVPVEPALAPEPSGPGGKSASASEAQAPAGRGETSTLQLDEVLARHGTVIVTGGPGMGKSTMTLQAVRNIAESLLAGKGAALTVPLRITATSLAEASGPFHTIVAKAASAQLGSSLDKPLPDRLLDQVPPGARWLVFIDGVDEITDRIRRREVLGELAARIAEEGAGVRFVIMTRPLPPGELELLSHPSVGRYQVVAFDSEQLTVFAHKWFGFGDEADTFLGRVRDAGLSEIVQIPLLAAIAATVYRKSSPLPGSRFELYENYLDHLTQARAAEASRQWKKLTAKHGNLPREDAKRVSDLFDRRMTVVRHVAETALSTADDLVDSAVRWTDTHGGNIGGPSSAWRELVAAALHCTNLFVWDGDRLRFVHHSFAEHLAAGEAAARLPVPFTVSSPIWSNALGDAVESSVVGDDSALATLVHYARSGSDRAKLFAWLESGPATCRILAARLLAAGAPADPERIGAFHALVEAAGEDPAIDSDVWLVAARIRDDAIADRLQDIAERGPAPATGRPLTVAQRLNVARALSAHSGPRGAHALRRIIQDPRCTPGERLVIAERLAELGGEHRDDAIAILRSLIAATGVDVSDRVDAVDTLGDLDASLVDERATLYRAIFAEPGADAGSREQAAAGLSKLGGDDAVAGQQAMLAILTDPGSDVRPRLWALADLVELVGGEHGGSASFAEPGSQGYQAIVGTGLSLITDPDIGLGALERAARLMVEFAPSQLGTVIKALCETAAQPGVLGWRRIEIARLLVRLDPSARPQAEAILQPIANSLTADLWDRIISAGAIAGLDSSFSESEAAALETIAGTLGYDAHERRIAAEKLVEVRPKRKDNSLRILRGIVDSADVDMADRLRALRAWKTLAPDQVTEVAEVLRSLVRLPGLSASDREDVLNALVNLGPMCWEEGFEIAWQMVSAAGVPVAVRLRIADDLAKVPDYTDKVRSALIGILGASGETTSDRVDAGKALIAMGPSHTVDAVEQLSRIMRSNGEALTDRLAAAEAISELGSAHVPVIQGFLIATLQDRTAPSPSRIEALRLLLLSSQDVDAAIARIIPMMR